jgi:CRP/FNR family transcriptional regulator
MDIADILNYQLRFFREADLKQELAENGKLVEVSAGTMIMKEGSYVKTIPILLNGLVKVVKEESAGREMLLYYIYPLESCIISIHCGLNDIKTRAKAIAEEDSAAIMISSSILSEWQRKYPSFNDFVLNLYQKRFNDVLDAYNALAFQKLDDRLIAYLKAKSEATKSHIIKSTHQTLADELGSARETISRMLKKLESDGLVQLHRGAIEITGG